MLITSTTLPDYGRRLQAEFHLMPVNSNPNGVPFSASTLQSTGDTVTDLNEDLAAEQKARTTYDNILRVVDDPEIKDPIRFLRAREVVHFQRFGEALEKTKDKLDAKNYYYANPEFDKKLFG